MRDITEVEKSCCGKEQGWNFPQMLADKAKVFIHVWNTLPFTSMHLNWMSIASSGRESMFNIY